MMGIALAQIAVDHGRVGRRSLAGRIERRLRLHVHGVYLLVGCRLNLRGLLTLGVEHEVLDVRVHLKRLH